jgi:hypothetical protein
MPAGQQSEEDNLAVTLGDYSHYCVTAPVNADLPGGGGYQICDLYDLSTATFGQVQNQTNASRKYGDRSNLFNANGIQRFNARLSPTWPTPLDIQQPRIVQVNAILQF